MEVYPVRTPHGYSLPHSDGGPARTAPSEDAAIVELSRFSSASVRASFKALAEMLRSQDRLPSTASESSDEQASEKLALSFQTKEGDTVLIEFSPAPQGEEGLPGIRVQGDLSDNEREALADLVTEIDSISDAFFEGGLNLDSLSSFDSRFLERFTFQLAQGAQHLVVGYGVDEKNARQALQVNFDNGSNSGSFDLESGFGASDAEDVQRYVQMIRDATGKGYQGDLSAEGRALGQAFTEGLTTIFELAEKLDAASEHASASFTNARQAAKKLFETRVKSDPRYQGLSAGTKGFLEEGLANVVNFSASFVADQGGAIDPNAERYKNFPKVKKGYSLSFGVKTEVEEAGGGVSQTTNFSLVAGYMGKGRVQSVQQSEIYKISLRADGQQVSASQTHESARNNYLRAYLGYGEALKKTENVAESAHSDAVIDPRFLLESNLLRRRGKSFSGVVAGNTVLAGGYKNEDTERSSTRMVIAKA